MMENGIHKKIKHPRQYHYLYKTTNEINGKIYIGIHSTNNLEDGYLGSGRHLRAAISKYGKENFHKEILEFFPTLDAALERERSVVTSEFCSRDDTYNIAVGGWCGGSLIAGKTEEELRIWRENISTAQKRRLAVPGATDKYKKTRNSPEFLKKFHDTHRRNEVNMSEEKRAERSAFFRKVHQTASENHSIGARKWRASISDARREELREINKIAQRKPEVNERRNATRALMGEITCVYKNMPFRSIKALWRYCVENEGYSYSYDHFKKNTPRTRFEDFEVRVDNIEVGKMSTALPGQGNVEYEGVAALHITYEGNDVKVGAGLSREQRIAWMKDPSLIVGKIITVKYFERTVNQQGKVSLRFPTLKVVHGAERDT